MDTPQVIKCRMCGNDFTLGLLGIDPRRQMRLHTQTHLSQVVSFARHSSWLLDMLLFDCPEDPEWWRRSIEATVEAILTSPPPELRYLKWTNPTSKTESSES